MSQIVSLWNTMDPRKRLVAILAALAVLVTVIGLARVVNQPSYALLYAGLDAATAGEVITRLESQAVQFEVRGDAIYVEANARDRVRMDLASQGLPANGMAGYELLDTMSGFSTTSQMFDAAYWRAKEGELARTILASPNVRSARVHIANPGNRPFDRKVTPSASVIVTMNSGKLGSSQAKAMRFLVSSAVAGLEPDNVSVIDSLAGVILAAGPEPEVSPGENTSQRANALRTNIERILAARVGQGNAIVEVNIDASMESETVSERILDPDSRVEISSENEETTAKSSGSGGAGVTVASNLPDGDVAGDGSQSQSSNSITSQRSNYEYSEIRRERTKQPGEIRRISVAVLVNAIETGAADGTTTETPRSEAEMEQLRELVKSAIGYDEARGDLVTVQSMAFTPVPDEGTAAQSGVSDFFAVNAMKLVQIGVLAIVALVLGLGVLRPLLARPPETALVRGEDGVLDPDGGEGNVELLGNGAELLELTTGRGPNGETELSPEALLENAAKKRNIDRLKTVVNDRGDASRQVLENWLDAKSA